MRASVRSFVAGLDYYWVDARYCTMVQSLGVVGTGGEGEMGVTTIAVVGPEWIWLNAGCSCRPLNKKIKNVMRCECGSGSGQWTGYSQDRAGQGGRGKEGNAQERVMDHESWEDLSGVCSVVNAGTDC